MPYGVQQDGSFERKHVDTIRQDLKRIFKNELGEDIELRPSSPIIPIIDATAIELARLCAAAEGAYYASFYQDASGEALDKQLALAGFSRIPTRPATGEVEFSRSDPAPSDVTISAGTTITTERTETRPRIPFETTEGVTLTKGATSVIASVEGLKPWQTDLDERWLGEETNVALLLIKEEVDKQLRQTEDYLNEIPSVLDVFWMEKSPAHKSLRVWNDEFPIQELRRQLRASAE